MVSRRYIQYPGVKLAYASTLRISGSRQFKDRPPTDPDLDPDPDPVPDGTAPVAINDLIAVTAGTPGTQASNRFDVTLNDIGTRPMTVTSAVLVDGEGVVSIAGNLRTIVFDASAIVNQGLSLIDYTVQNAFGTSTGRLTVAIASADNPVGIAPVAFDDVLTVDTGSSGTLSGNRIDVTVNDTGERPLIVTSAVKLSGDGAVTIVNQKILAFNATAAVSPGTTVIEYTVANAFGSDKGLLTVTIVDPLVITDDNFVGYGADVIGTASNQLGVAQPEEEEPPPTDSAFVPEGYTISFRDEFGASVSIDTTTTLAAEPNGIWAPYFPGLNLHFLSANQDQCYKTHQDDAGNTAQTLAERGITDLHTINAAGDLVLKVHLMPSGWTSSFGTKPHVGGMISSEKTFAQTFGYFEVRARFKTLQPGLRWSIRLLPKGGGTQQIDMVEAIGNTNADPSGPIDILFFNSTGESPNLAQTQIALDPGEVDDFHVYGFLWDEDVMEWYLDGVKVREHANFITATEMYLLITPETSTGSGALQGPVQLGTVFPDVAEIDYVRVYENTAVEEPPPPPPQTDFIKPHFGTAFAPWAIPARFLPTHPNSAALKNELFAITPARFNLQSAFFAPVIYDLREANSTITLVGKPNLVNSNLSAGTQIPWNYQKFTAPKNFDSGDVDSYVLLINFQTGECFEIFQSLVIPPNKLECLVALKIKQGKDNFGTADANVFTKDNGFEVSRACGVQHCVGLITRKEINAGVIPHCMTMLWANPTKFSFQAFATKGAGGTGGAAGRGFMGMRLVFDGLTDADINAWLNTRPAATRNVMRIIANCIRDYGFFGSDHGGFAPLQRGGTQMEHTLSAKWNEVGLTDENTRTALFTLLEPNRAKSRVVAVPNFIGGNRNNVACYPGIPYPPGHPCAG